MRMRMKSITSHRIQGEPVESGGAGMYADEPWRGGRSATWAWLGLGALVLGWLALAAGVSVAAQNVLSGTAQRRVNLPPRVVAAQRFLAERGWTRAKAGSRINWRTGTVGTAARTSAAGPQGSGAATATWQPLGPAAMLSLDFGSTPVPVTGRVSALALDISDSSDIRLYAGTTGGGVWMAKYADASNASTVAFIPLTDTVEALSGAVDASISIGALTVQAGGTGVILAGTGDPNDELDSYYGAGILRSGDGGNSWTLIQSTLDAEQGLSGQDFSFVGEGFSGFAWSTLDAQRVVAAVSQAWEGVLVSADRPGQSYEGLYYSKDGGASWHLATITDGGGKDVQGPLDTFTSPDGNAATSVVWNPVRKLFMAAVRYHGYYQSPDGITWTRMVSQPASALTTGLCPTNPGTLGSQGCAMYRGTLAVNPQTGDTFAWTVGSYNSVTGQWPNLGIWQDACGINNAGNACTNQTIAFTELPWFPGTSSTNPTVADGGYALALAAVPYAVGLGNDTLLFAGADDLWKCSLAMGCQWRNTTNATAGFCAQVGAYQHAVAWNPLIPTEVFLGNDSGLWRSMDQIGESGAVCGSGGNTDAGHFQNLNGSLGSLAEVESLSQAGNTPYTMMAGLGVNGTAGVKSSTGVTAEWPQILGGNGGPVAIDPRNSNNWYVNNQYGVSIYLCAQAGGCTPSDFGTSPVVDMNGPYEDGYTMSTPAPFLVDPVDPTQLLIGTCRVWRVPADGIVLNGTDAISPILDSGVTNTICNGDSPVRAMAAMALAGGDEIVYAGMYGWSEGGFSPYGQVWSAIFNPASSTMPTWANLSSHSVNNDNNPMNSDGMDISSIFIDPHDPTGKTVYVTVEGMPSPAHVTQLVYRSTDGGASWTNAVDNLPAAPANNVVVDPQDANTVYVATDVGVYFTTQIANCVVASSDCWSAFGTGLPEAPVVALSAAPVTASQQVLIAGTYGRGVWDTPLWTAGTALTTASANPDALTFAIQEFGTASGAQPVTLENTGSLALMPTTITMNGDFTETDNCQKVTVVAGRTCTIQVKFTPTETGSRTGEMIIGANVYGGQLTVGLSGTGSPAGAVSLTPATVGFGLVKMGTTSASLPVAATNTSATAVPITGVVITSPFTIASNSCGTTTLVANTACQIEVAFAPTQRGPVAGALSFTDGAGTQTVALNGTGAAPAADSLPTTSLTFPATVAGQLSAAQTAPLSNTGDLALTSISISVSGPFEASNNCGTQLGSNSSCTLSVVFAPQAAGTQTGTLTVTDAVRTQTIALSGTGVQPTALTVSPTSLNFATLAPGESSSARTVTITNSNSFAATALTLSAIAPFSLTQDTCPTNLGAGASCTVGVLFQPTTYGAYTGRLPVISPAEDSPSAVALSGMSSDFAVAASGSTTQTVANKQTASYTLSVTPVWVSAANFSPGGTFTFTCGTLPTNAVCVFNPSSLQVSAGTSGTVTVQIDTGGTGSSAALSPPARWSALPLVCGLVVLPLAFWGKRKKTSVLVALIAFSICGGISSCTKSGGGGSGGSGGSSTTGTTPTGSYTIPVTVVSNGVQHSINLTLTVD
jgi:hypothetical protein